MGSRGRRSSADLATYRPDLPLIPVNLDTTSGDQREAERALRRRERQGELVSQTAPDGSISWFRYGPKSSLQQCDVRAIDETNHRYGKLVVIKAAPSRRKPSGGSPARWVCQCDCGETVTTTGGALRSGGALSCGCGQIEANKRRKRSAP